MLDNINNLKIPSLADLGVIRQEVKLFNDMRVILFEMPHAPISISIAFLAGSIFDPMNKDGCAHFLEHMLVAGTKSFPRKDLLTLPIERLGGRISASTNPSILKIDLTVSEAIDIDLAVNLMNEILTASLFSAETIETERGSILKEIGISKSSLEGVAKQAWNELVFQDTLLSSSVLGREESIGNLSENDLLSYFKNYIVADRATIVACGGIEMKELANILENKLHLPLRQKRIAPDQKSLPIIRKQKISLKFDSKSEQVHLVSGFRTVPIFHEDIAILRFIAGIIGNDRSSLLLQRLRYEKGLVYGINAVSSNHLNAGEFSIHTSTSAKQFSENVSAITEVIRDIRENGLSEDLISAKKEQLVKSLRIRFQTSNDWTAGHLFHEAVGLSGKTVLDWTKEFMDVTNEDIIRVANKYFTNDNLYMAVAGNVTEKDVPELRV